MSNAVIGSLRVILGADTAHFDRAMQKTQGTLNKFDREASALGKRLSSAMNFSLPNLNFGGLAAGAGAAGLAVAGLTLALQGMGRALQSVDDLVASANKLGTTAERFQELTFAAAEFDVTTESLTSGMQGLNSALGAFKSGVGDGRVKKVFEALGLTKADLVGVNDAAAFLPILANKIAAVQSQAARVKLAKALGAEELLPMLEQGGAAIDRTTERAHKLGIVMSNELAAKAADANRELEIMSNIANAQTSIALANLGTWAVDLTKKLEPLIERLKEVYQGIRDADQASQRKVGQDFRRKAEEIEAANGGAGTRQSRLYREKAEVFDPGGGDRPMRGPSTRGIGQRLGRRDTDTGDIPGLVTPGAGGGGGGGRSRSGGGSRARYNGKLPANILRIIADGRMTEETARALWADGVFPAEMAVLSELNAPITIDPRTVWDAMEPASIDAAPTGFEATNDRVRDLMEPINEALEASREKFRDVFSGGLMAALRGGEEGLAEWMRAGAERGLEQALNNLSDLLFDLFRSAMGQGGSTGGGGGGWIDVLGSVMGYFSGGGIPGFATGGSFTVGGSGGTDSKLMQIRATPGEHVNITHGDPMAKLDATLAHLTNSFQAVAAALSSPVIRVPPMPAFHRDLTGGVDMGALRSPMPASIGSGERGERRGKTNVFDLRGAVVTQDLLNQMNQIAAQGDAKVIGVIAREKQRESRSLHYRAARGR